MATLLNGMTCKTLLYSQRVCVPHGRYLFSSFVRQNAVSLNQRVGPITKLHPMLTVQKATFCTRHTVKVKLRQAIRILSNYNAVILGSNALLRYIAFFGFKLRRTFVVCKDFLIYHSTLGQRLAHLQQQFLRKTSRPLTAMLGATVFSWDSERITQAEMKKFSDEIRDMYTDKDGKVHGELEKEWEVVINKKDLLAWRKPVPNTELYEYKMFGTFNDIPARAFFNAQADVEYRREWDSLIIKLDIVERDPMSGSEVVQWIMKFPYPMYSREYVFVRRRVVDRDNRLMVLMARATDHPQCPKQDQYVRVNTYMSRMVIRPHNSFDENGFDFVLTYYDDPQANFPRVAYNWMAQSGVPDYALKMHKAAKTMHEWQQKGKWRSMDDEEEQQQQKQQQQGGDQRVPM